MARIPSSFTQNVFINCPFDDIYTPLFNAIIFTIHDIGFRPRCALEASNAGQVRLDKLYQIISECKYSVHDLSRTQLDKKTGLPRFNMPLELGFFLGAIRYGSSKRRQKRCLVLDRERYRYRNFCSDIAGQDIRAHKDHPRDAIRAVRDWLSTHRKSVQMPGGTAIFDRYERFRAQLAVQARDVHLEVEELTFGDYTKLVVGWLTKNPW
jgi:hypothetical protein